MTIFLATGKTIGVIVLVILIDRLKVILEEAFGALGKGPVLFAGSPFVQTLAVDLLAPTLTHTRRDHSFGTVFLQTYPTHLFVVVESTAALNHLKGGWLKVVVASGIEIKLTALFKITHGFIF